MHEMGHSIRGGTSVVLGIVLSTDPIWS